MDPMLRATPGSVLSEADVLTWDMEDRGGLLGSSVQDSAQPPQHHHRLRGTHSSTGDVKGRVGKGGHILRFLDEVRDAWGGRRAGVSAETDVP